MDEKKLEMMILIRSTFLEMQVDTLNKISDRFERSLKKFYDVGSNEKIFDVLTKLSRSLKDTLNSFIEICRVMEEEIEKKGKS